MLAILLCSSIYAQDLSIQELNTKKQYMEYTLNVIKYLHDNNQEKLMTMQKFPKTTGFFEAQESIEQFMKDGSNAKIFALANNGNQYILNYLNYYITGTPWLTATKEQRKLMKDFAKIGVKKCQELLANHYLSILNPKAASDSEKYMYLLIKKAIKVTANESKNIDDKNAAEEILRNNGYQQVNGRWKRGQSLFNALINNQILEILKNAPTPRTIEFQIQLDDELKRAIEKNDTFIPSAQNYYIRKLRDLTSASGKYQGWQRNSYALDCHLTFLSLSIAKKLAEKTNFLNSIARNTSAKTSGFMVPTEELLKTLLQLKENIYKEISAEELVNFAGYNSVARKTILQLIDNQLFDAYSGLFPETSNFKDLGRVTPGSKIFELLETKNWPELYEYAIIDPFIEMHKRAIPWFIDLKIGDNISQQINNILIFVNNVKNSLLANIQTNIDSKTLEYIKDSRQKIQKFLDNSFKPQIQRISDITLKKNLEEFIQIEKLLDTDPQTQKILDFLSKFEEFIKVALKTSNQHIELLKPINQKVFDNNTAIITTFNYNAKFANDTMIWTKLMDAIYKNTALFSMYSQFADLKDIYRKLICQSFSNQNVAIQYLNGEGVFSQICNWNQIYDENRRSIMIEKAEKGDFIALNALCANTFNKDLRYAFDDCLSDINDIFLNPKAENDTLGAIKESIKGSLSEIQDSLKQLMRSDWRQSKTFVDFVEALNNKAQPYGTLENAKEELIETLNKMIAIKTMHFLHLN